MDKMVTKKTLLAWLMLLAYMASGCGMSSRGKKNDKNSNDIAIAHEWCLSQMDIYKENSFIKDFGIFSDECPEFYVGVQDSERLGVLNNVFNYLVGNVPFSIDQYYLNLMEKYENKQYEIDKDGNLVFAWDDEYKFGDFDETLFSHREEYYAKINKFVDKKDGKVVYSRSIQDFGNRLENKIVVYKDLAKDVHATIEATNSIIPVWLEKGYEEANNVVETVLTIDYHGKNYIFICTSETFAQGDFRYSITLPDGVTFDKEKADCVSDRSESKDFLDFDNLMSLICDTTNYKDGENKEAVLYFEHFQRKIDSVVLFGQGSPNNPWYAYIQELMDGGDYETALSIMQSDGTYWLNEMQR